MSSETVERVPVGEDLSVPDDQRRLGANTGADPISAAASASGPEASPGAAPNAGYGADSVPGHSAPGTSVPGYGAGYGAPGYGASGYGAGYGADWGTGYGAPAGRSRFYRHFWAKTGFLLGGFLVTLMFFVVCIVGMALAVGTAIIYIGVPIGAATLVMAHGFARAKRAWLARCGVDIPLLPQRPAEPGAGPLRRIRRVYASGERWREYLYAIVDFPLAAVTFALTLAWWAISLNGLTYWFWSGYLPKDGAPGYRDPVTGEVQNKGLADLLHLSMGNTWLYFWMGLFTLATLVPLTHAMSLIHAGTAKGLVRPSRAAMEKRVAQLAGSRQQAAAAQTRDLRRIEQDLHDGPQQRLVRLGMDLATAQRRLDGGDETAAAALLEEARGQVSATLAEIRQISRSVAPPILADQGLAAAIEALGATSPVPAVVEAEPVELSDAAATAVYFAASEALANVAKHSGATGVSIQLWRAQPAGAAGALVCCQVDDDGAGGAMVVPGHGLAGLRDRLAGVDGLLDVVARDGGGTSIRIAVPAAQ
jgi:signal transduction histidine kinase